MSVMNKLINYHDLLAMGFPGQAFSRSNTLGHLQPAVCIYLQFLYILYIFYNLLLVVDQIFLCPVSLGNEVVTVNTPAFAESVSEGDVRWEKGR